MGWKVTRRALVYIIALRRYDVPLLLGRGHNEVGGRVYAGTDIAIHIIRHITDGVRVALDMD